MTDEMSRHQLWQAGIIAPWYLRDDQLPIYELLQGSKRPFVECSRRYGKATTILCYVLEQLLQNPGWVCLWCEPDKNQAREIVKPEMTKLFKTAPEELTPIWSAEDSFYWFPSTGTKDFASRLKLRGVNHDRGDSARGPYAHIIVADEYGFWKDPGYTIREALAPQLQTTEGPLIKASTPPEDLGHPYYEEKSEAIADRRFVKRIIYDNESLSKAQFDQVVKDCKGIETPAFKREYLCEPVSDPERLVIPEYAEAIHLVDDDHPRPDHYDTYVGLDLGFNDCTAAVFGYWDFKTRTLVIEDEFVAHGRNSGEIAEACKRREKSLWGELEPFKRVGDNDLQQLYDLSTMSGYSVLPTLKDDKLAAINALRLRFGEGKIKIKKRCVSLAYQLKVGLWNERKTDFLRGEKTGHLDAVDALIYLHRNIDEHHNPYPQNVGVSEYTHLINPFHPKEGSRDEEALKQLFG
jgi:hypothetical protein